MTLHGSALKGINMGLQFTPSDGSKLAVTRKGRAKKPLPDGLLEAIARAETQPLTINGIPTKSNANTLLSKIRTAANEQDKGVRGVVFEDGETWSIEFSVGPKRAVKPKNEAVTEPTPEPVLSGLFS